MVITVFSRAKINLTLDILGKRPDGYHEVETVMQCIKLYDHLEFTPAAEGITLVVEGGDAPPGEENLVFRAAALFRTHMGVKAGVNIRLTKLIPVSAGLGGGSTNAAATLAALNNMWRLGLSSTELAELGAQLGSDVPFCLMGGTALARGRGELLERLPPCPPLGLVLVKPPFGVSTALAYENFRPEQRVAGRPDNRAMLRAMQDNDITGIAGNLANALEPAVMSMHPEIAEIKEKLQQAGVLGTLMTGSGPTVFGITPDAASAGLAASRYQSSGERVLVSETFNPVY